MAEWLTHLLNDWTRSDSQEIHGMKSSSDVQVLLLSVWKLSSSSSYLIQSNYICKVLLLFLHTTHFPKQTVVRAMLHAYPTYLLNRIRLNTDRKCSIQFKVTVSEMNSCKCSKNKKFKIRQLFQPDLNEILLMITT